MDMNCGRGVSERRDSIGLWLGSGERERERVGVCFKVLYHLSPKGGSVIEGSAYMGLYGGGLVEKEELF